MRDTATLRKTVCSKREEAIRKDIEQFLAALQGRFTILWLPMQLRYVEEIAEKTNATVNLPCMVGQLRTENGFENEKDDGSLSHATEKNADIVDVMMSDARACWKDRQFKSNTTEASVAAMSRHTQGKKAQLDDLAYSYSVIANERLDNAMTKEFMDPFLSESEWGDLEVNNEKILWTVIRRPWHR